MYLCFVFLFTEKTREVDPILTDKEISHDKVIIEQKLGEGEFGVVHMGKVTGMKNKVEDVTVAIKTTKGDVDIY